MNFTPKQFKEYLNGVVAIITTPWKENGELDEEALREQIEHIKSNFRGEKNLSFLAGGSVGEFYVMDDEEWIHFAKVVVDAVGGEFPVMVGSGRAGTAYTIKMSKIAEELGADGVTIINPYYLPPTEEGFIRHIEDVAKAVNIAVIPYDNQFASKITLTPNVLRKVSKIENVIAVKENSMNAIQFQSFLDAVDPEDMTIITGAAEGMFSWTCLHGSTAFISANVTFLPELTKQFMEAAKNKDVAKMSEILKKESELNAFTAKVAMTRSAIPTVEAPAQVSAIDPVVQMCFKKCQDLIGLHGGHTRAPMEDNLSENEVEELRGILRRLGCNVVA